MLPWHLIIVLAVFLIGVTKSGFGSGAGLMIIPMTAIAMGKVASADLTLPFLLPLLMSGDFLAVWQYRKHFSLQVILRLLPGTFLGILLASLLLKWFSSQGQLAQALTNLEIGFESVILVSLNWYREWRSVHGIPAYRPSIAKSAAVGVFAGASSTLAHAAGPIIALHLLPQRLERGVFVGTCALYFFIVNAAKIPGYYLTGQFSKLPLTDSLRFLPLVFAGAAFGFWINRKINDALFSKLVYAITFFLGLYVLARGANGLFHFAPAL